MTAEEVFCDLYAKYGDEFNWHLIPLSNRSFVAELKREIDESHFLYKSKLYAVAKCDANDDVLYVTGNNGVDEYYIFHLTYSENNQMEFPRYQKFLSIEEVKEFLEKQFIEEYR